MSTPLQIYDASIALIASVDATLDLTGVGAVVKGRLASVIPMTPIAYLAPAEVVYDDSQAAMLGLYNVQIVLDLVIVVSQDDVGQTDNVSAALVALDDVVAAYATNRSVSATAYNSTVKLNGMDGTEINRPHYGIVFGQITIDTVRE